MDSVPPTGSDGDDLSPVERLPKELLFHIIEYIPERVFDLRLTSQMLRSIVDEYANLRVNIPLADRLEFVQTGWNSNEDEISAQVSKNRANIFELRLKLRYFPFALNTRIKRSFHKMENQPNVYKIKFSSLDQNDSSLVKECMGPIVGTVSIFDHVGKNFEGVIKQLDGKTDILNQGHESAKCCWFYRFARIAHFSDLLLKFLKSRQINHLSLGIGESRIRNIGSFLVEISSVVRSLYLWQRDVATAENFIATGPNWASIVPAMFKRRMDALCIDNFINGQEARNQQASYLSRGAAEKLLFKLPLVGKPIWFESRLNLIGTDAVHQPIDITINAHVIERGAIPSAARRADFLEHLSAKHESRLMESYRVL